MIRYLLPALCLCILTGCGLGIGTNITRTYPSLKTNDTIRVYYVNQLVPEDVTQIGTVSIYDKMTFNCDSMTVFNAAKEEARKAGGNILKITKHRKPNLGSSCHQVDGLIYKIGVDIKPVDTTFVSKEENLTSREYREMKDGKNSLPYPVPISKYRLALSAGPAWQTAKIEATSSFEKEYLEELKSGISYLAEFDYFFSERTAISLQAGLFHSKYSTPAYGLTNSGTVVSGILSDNINILFIAPGVMWRLLSRSRMNAVNFGVSVGYTHYKDEGGFVSEIIITGKTVGFSYDVGVDFVLSNSTSLGFGVSWKIGSIGSVDITQNGITEKKSFDGKRLGVGHIDLLVGLRFK